MNRTPRLMHVSTRRCYLLLPPNVVTAVTGVNRRGLLSLPVATYLNRGWCNPLPGITYYESMTFVTPNAPDGVLNATSYRVVVLEIDVNGIRPPLKTVTLERTLLSTMTTPRLE